MAQLVAQRDGGRVSGVLTTWPQRSRWKWQRPPLHGTTGLSGVGGTSMWVACLAVLPATLRRLGGGGMISGVGGERGAAVGRGWFSLREFVSAGGGRALRP